MITSTIRGALRLASIATAATAIWLVSVVLFVLPSRDPGNVQVWAGVALAAGILVGLSIAATRQRDGAGVASLAVLASLGLVSAVALAFGMLVVVSFVTTVAAGASEDYLVVVGAILAVHGAFGLAWSGLSLVAARPRIVRTGAPR